MTPLKLRAEEQYPEGKAVVAGVEGSVTGALDRIEVPVRESSHGSVERMRPCCISRTCALSSQRNDG